MLSAPAHTHTGETPGAHHTDDDTLADAAPVEALSCVDATPRTMSPRPKGLRHTIAVACGKIMGLILLALSAVVFSTLGLFVSVLAPRFSAFEVAALRFYGQTVVTVAMLFVTGAPARVPREKWVWLFLRAFCGSSSMTLFYFAITHMPLAEANVLLFTNPVICLFLGYLVLKESFTKFDATIILISLVGVVFVVQPEAIFGPRADAPHTDTSSPSPDGMSVSIVAAAMAALVGAFFAATAFVSIRKMKELNPVTITLWFSLLGCCTTSMLTLATGGYAVPTTLSDGVMISITGLMGFLGQMLMTKGFQLADNAGSASMIRQLDVVCAFIFQVFLEHQPASLWSVVGATIIIGCVCLIGAKKCQRSNNPSGMMLQDDDVPGASSADTKNVVVEFAQLSQHTDHEQHGLAEASGPAGTSRFLVQSQLSTTPRAASDTRMLLIDDSSEDDSDLLSDEASGAS